MLINAFRRVSLARYCTVTFREGSSSHYGGPSGEDNGNRYYPDSEALEDVNVAVPLAEVGCPDVLDTPEDTAQEADGDTIPSAEPAYRDRIAARINLYDTEEPRSLGSI